MRSRRESPWIRRSPVSPVPRPATALVAVVLLAAMTAPAQAAPQRITAAAADPVATYIVQLAAPPIAGYSGGIHGFAATSPRATGRKVDLTSAAAREYGGYLDGQEREVLARAGAGSEAVIERYRTAFPGFAARLTPQQVASLSTTPGVARVYPDSMGHPLQAAPPSPGAASPVAGEAPDFLGLPQGIWKQLGGPDAAGAGIIIGVIDTGIYPEHPSFADQPVGADGRQNYIGPPYTPPNVWQGACEAGEEFPSSTCNNKLIGARFFVNDFGTDNLHPREFVSPRDSNGHGSHTASTAAGNYGVDPVVGGSDLGVDLISGVAPRAYIAAYKVCWSGKPDPANPTATVDGCKIADSIKAIDTAVADGVDVINFSVGTAATETVDPLELAFMFASNAGVFVATAAGNGGPQPGSIASPATAPWVTSVAASTLGRDFRGTASALDLDPSGTTPALTFAEVPTTGTLAPTPLVDAAAVPAPGRTPEESELCLPGSLDKASVDGKAVLCKRGKNLLIEKGKVVLDAGGAAMVLYNAPEKDDVVPILHWLPAVHIKAADGLAVKKLLTEAHKPGVSITEGTISAAPDLLAPFSARGPQGPVPDVAKPDLTAPGVNILAAGTPFPSQVLLRPGETFDILSGTSMASPHVAGAAALLSQLHPLLSPAAIKSSLMTTAKTRILREDGVTPAGPFESGSGRIDPSRAGNPGLILDLGEQDYAGFLESVDPNIVVGEITPIAAADLNLPAVSFGGFLDAAATTRTFTGVDPVRTTWRVSVEGLPGMKADVQPALFTVAPAEQVRLTIQLQRAGAPFDAYTAGSVVLTDRDSGRVLHLPVTIEPVRMKVDGIINMVTELPKGSQDVPFKAGIAGQISASAYGLAAPVLAAGQKVGPGQQMPTPKPGPGVNVHDVVVKPGTQVLAGAISNFDGGASSADLDLYAYFDAAGDGFTDEDLIGLAASQQPLESLGIILPDPGAYRFSVVGYSARTPYSTYDFQLWQLADRTPDNPVEVPGLVASGEPAQVVPGQEATYKLDWVGLPQDGTYLGLVSYSEGPPKPETTFGSSLVVLEKGRPGVTLQSWEVATSRRSPVPAPRNDRPETRI